MMLGALLDWCGLGGIEKSNQERGEPEGSSDPGRAIPPCVRCAGDIENQVRSRSDPPLRLGRWHSFDWGHARA